LGPGADERGSDDDRKEDANGERVAQSPQAKTDTQNHLVIPRFNRGIQCKKSLSFLLDGEILQMIEALGLM